MSLLVNTENVLILDKNNTKSKNNERILEIIDEIQSSKIPSIEIRKKWGLTQYQYYKFIKEHNLKTDSFRKGPKCPSGPKNTKFKQLLYGTEEEQKEAKILPDNLNIEDFKCDCTINKLKISEIMSKYNLTLYQVRELRILHDVKTK